MSVVARRSKASPPAIEPLAAAPSRWVMLMPNLPAKAGTPRVRVWRRLQAVGAVAVRPSVYVLPNRDRHVETFQWIAREIVALGGQASLCEGAFLDGASDAEVERKMVEARTADYEALAADAREAGKLVTKKRADASAAEPIVARLRKRLDEIAAIDFFAAPGREAVATAVADLERALVARRAPLARAREELPRMERPRGATWVTRKGVHVDRIACAWLIRRFVDPEARFELVAPAGYVPPPGVIRFDMYEAELTHVGDRCSFEVIVERMGVDDPALGPMAEMVHELDVRDGKFERPETAGFAAQITGICAAHRDDHARIAAASPILDALHAFFTVEKRPKKRPGRA